ncbi:MAG: hypothetical protein GY952_17740 [Rhodobacteraceae bacterium]|nr:hypothetical protein [Paracoccaceae bacterium]
MRDTMKQVAFAACLLAFIGIGQAGPVKAAGEARMPDTCTLDLLDPVPQRSAYARTGSAFVEEILRLAGPARNVVVAEQVLAGNIPDFLRRLIPVTLRWTPLGGAPVEVTICVTSDYLAVGRDSDFVRVPMGLPAAADVAARLGFILPTTKMVDAIYTQAQVRLPPAPMPPTSAMQSTDYFWRHNRTVEEQISGAAQARSALTAGQKKDLVLSNRLHSKPGRVAIYGWHRPNGKPIQPLSTVHGKNYADYSHGVRLVSMTAYVNGQPRRLSDILQDPRLAHSVNSEGPITRLDRLLNSLR